MGAYDGSLQIVPGLVAAADLSAKQYTLVQINASGLVAANVTQGAVCIGVLQDKPDAANKAASVANFGVSYVVLGGTVVPGDKVMSDTAGRAILTTGNYYTMGICLVGGTVGAVGTVLIYPSGAANPSNSTTTTLAAAADYSSNQYFFVNVDSSGDAEVNTTLGARVAGVLQGSPDITEDAVIAFAGVTNVLLGATVDEGDFVMSDAAGECIKATSENAVVGVCLTGGANGATGIILLTPNAKNTTMKTFEVAAGADLQLLQYFFMKIDSSGEAVVNAGSGDVGVGVLINTPDTAEQAIIAYDGVVPILIGATLDEGELVMADAAGEAIPATTGEFAMGTCLVGGANGATGSMVLTPKHYIP